MVTVSGLAFIAKSLERNDVKGKRVLDIGSFGSTKGIRPLMEAYAPAKYTGVDVRKGEGVDIVCGIEDLQKKFKENSFDIVISTEVVEHIRDWRAAISAMKHILKQGGILIITTRSRGFEYHMSPKDYWRYEPQDMRRIFSDFKALSIEKDYLDPGVFVMARKPKRFRERDLSDYELYSMVADKRVKDIDDNTISAAYAAGLAKSHLKLAIYKTGVFLFSKRKNRKRDG